MREIDRQPAVLGFALERPFRLVVKGASKLAEIPHNENNLNQQQSHRRIDGEAQMISICLEWRNSHFSVNAGWLGNKLVGRVDARRPTKIEIGFDDWSGNKRPLTSKSHLCNRPTGHSCVLSAIDPLKSAATCCWPVSRSAGKAAPEIGRPTATTTTKESAFDCDCHSLGRHPRTRREEAAAGDAQREASIMIVNHDNEISKRAM